MEEARRSVGIFRTLTMYKGKISVGVGSLQEFQAMLSRPGAKMYSFKDCLEIEIEIEIEMKMSWTFE